MRDLLFSIVNHVSGSVGTYNYGHSRVSTYIAVQSKNLPNQGLYPQTHPIAAFPYRVLCHWTPIQLPWTYSQLFSLFFITVSLDFYNLSMVIT